MSDHVPNTEPLPCSASATIQEEIYLHSLSVYEKPRLAAQSLKYLLKPLSHGPGQPHYISVYLLSLLLDYSLEDLKQWAAAKDCFVKLVWIFPGWDHPKFTTRHLLVTDTAAPGHVSFSGGLDWAVNMWKVAQRLQPPSCPFLGPQSAPRWNLGRPRGDPKLSLPPVPFMDMDKWKPEYPALAYPVGYLPAGPADDEVSEFSEPEPGHADTASVGSSSGLFSEPSEAADSNFGEDSWSKDRGGGSSRAERLLQREVLRRRMRDAEALYARNGDPSGLLAVLSTASQSPDNWDSAGMPRF
ncbi:uncharacterized protein B0H64DRAFT_441580 [Chaetomium fimeti]|uniref:Uncharacterized protein n=1 Tax=Chaetomium fimeti TaxID=1854472 RepID=A0AAE0LRU6_9PEZI|nr:hypothetical protein B0H64DRAFT_441580 [Chaetomium fimeti]